MDKFELLKQYFGHDSFRDGQENIMIIFRAAEMRFVPTGGESRFVIRFRLMSDGIAIIDFTAYFADEEPGYLLNQNGIRAYINSTLTPPAQQSRKQFITLCEANTN